MAEPRPRKRSAAPPRPTKAKADSPGKASRELPEEAATPPRVHEKKNRETVRPHPGPTPPPIAIPCPDAAAWTELQQMLDRRRADLERREKRRFRRATAEVSGRTTEIVRAVGEPGELSRTLGQWKSRSGFSETRRTGPTERWDEVLREAWGETLANQTRAVGFRGGWLTVGVWNQALLGEMAQFRQTELTGKIRTLLEMRTEKTIFRGIRFQSARK